LRGNQLPLGKAALVTLSPSDSVLLTPAPAKPAPAGTFSGILWIDVARPATYRIALSGAAWLDVVGKTGVLASTAHAHGPECSGIRKMVDFTLAPGRYTINIAGSASPTITVLALIP
jgi:hypothetical protein